MSEDFSLTDERKDYARKVPTEIVEHLAKIVCLQIVCLNEGINFGQCVTCRDTAESVIGEYLRLTKK